MHKSEMSELKDRRQKAMADLIREHVLAKKEEVAARLSALGFEVLKETPKRGADNKLVCFLHPKTTNGVLIELCQEIRS